MAKNRAKNPYEGVNVRVKSLEDLYVKRKMLRDFKEGEDAIKADSKYYLPKFPTESTGMYTDRVNNSYLFNILAIIIQRISTKPLNKQIQIIAKNADGSENTELVNTMYNFNNEGNTLLDFARDAFAESLWYNQGYAIVEGENVAMIDVDDILQVEVSKGELLYFRFKDVVVQRNGFKEEEIQVIREFEKINDKVYLTIYVETEAKSDVFEITVDHDEYFINEIPVVRFYPFGTKCEFNPDLYFKPVASMQKAIFKQDSDITNMLGIAAVPFLFFKGVDINDDEEPLIISAFNALSSNLDFSDIKYVEATCSSLNVLISERNNMLDKAQSLTIDLLSKNMANVTATSSLIDEANNNAMLSCAAVALQEFLEKIIDLKYKFKLGVAVPTFNISLTTDFSIRATVEELNFLTQCKTLGVISSEDLYVEGQRRGIFDTTKTYEEVMANKDKETSSSSFFPE